LPAQTFAALFSGRRQQTRRDMSGNLSRERRRLTKQQQQLQESSIPTFNVCAKFHLYEENNSVPGTTTEFGSTCMYRIALIGESTSKNLAELILVVNKFHNICLDILVMMY
jgi:hypothetical protein